MHKLKGKKAMRHEQLRQLLINITLQSLAEHGLSGINARKIAKQAKCSVGTLYNIFGDLNQLTLAACAVTLNEFKVFAEQAYNNSHERGDGQKEKLLALSGAYIDFSRQHKRRWQANFELELTPEGDFFKAYSEGQSALLAIIVSVLKEIAPSQSEKQLFYLGRALWSSVHGIGMLSIANPNRHISREKVLEQCTLIILPVIEDLKRKQMDSQSVNSV